MWPELEGVAVILTVEVDGKNYHLLSVPDPRWRVDVRGMYRQIPALQDGIAAKLPILGLKAVGGFLDRGKTPYDMALDELKEEGGEMLSAMAAQSGLTHITTLKRSMDRYPAMQIDVHYFHAHLKISRNMLHRVIEPGDDCLAMALFETGAIARNGDDYSLSDPPLIFHRANYVHIPYEKDHWRLTPERKAVLDFYNEHGPANPLIGVDVDRLKAPNLPIIAPEEVMKVSMSIPAPTGGVSEALRPSA